MVGNLKDAIPHLGIRRIRKHVLGARRSSAGTATEVLVDGDEEEASLLFERA